MALIDFINPNAPQGDTFNYGTESDKIKRKRELASYLKKQGLSQSPTEVIGGWAVQQSPWTHLSKVLQAGMGAYMDNKVDGDQGALDTRSQDELVKALNDEPWKDRARQAQIDREALSELDRESRRGVVSTPEEQVSQAAEGAQTFPVEDRSQFIEARPLPPSQPSPKAVASALQGKPEAGAGRGFVNPPLATEPQPLQPAIDLGPPNPATAGRKARQAALSAGLQGAPLPQAAPQQPPQPPMGPQAAPQGAMPQGVTQPVPPQPPQPQPPQPAATGPIGDPRMLTEQAAAAAQPTREDAIKQIVKIANTGPMGQQIAQGMFQQAFGPKAQGLEFKAVKQGDNEVLVAVNPRTGQSQTVWQGASAPSVAQQRLDFDREEAEKKRAKEVNAADAAQQGQAGDLASTYRSFRSLVYPEKGQDGIADASGWFDNLKAKVPGTDAQRVQDLAKRDLSKLVLSFMQQMQQGGAGVSAFNSDAESKRLEQAAASINWTNEASATQAAKDILTQMEASGNRLNTARRQQGMAPIPMPWEQSSGPKTTAQVYGF